MLDYTAKYGHFASDGSSTRLQPTKRLRDFALLAVWDDDVTFRPDGETLACLARCGKATLVVGEGSSSRAWR